MLDALRVRDGRRSTLRTKLESLNMSATTVPLDAPVIEARVRERLAEWRGLLGRQVAWTRQLFKLLGSPAEHKRRVIYETSHAIPRNAVIKKSWRGWTSTGGKRRVEREANVAADSR
jgi:hypothetical protein